MVDIHVRLFSYGNGNGEEVQFATTNRDKAFAAEIFSDWENDHIHRVNLYDEVHSWTEDGEVIDKYEYDSEKNAWVSYLDRGPDIPLNIIIQETSCPPETATPTLPVQRVLTPRTST